MTLVRVLGKGRVGEIDADDFAAWRAAATDVAVDIGTGDGRFVLSLARQHPDRLAIGIDALAEPMEANARKAPANALFVRASVEGLPEELRAVADTVTVLLPWGRLLEGIVLGDDAVVGGIAAVGRSGARVDIVLNGEIWQASTPVRYEDLPLATPEYVADFVAPSFARAGVEFATANWMSAADAKALQTTWARKLGHGRDHPHYLRVIGVRR